MFTVVNGWLHGRRGVSAEEARKRVQSGATLLDVCWRGEWDALHAVGAIHLSLDILEEQVWVLPAVRSVVVMGRSVAAARTAIVILSRAGLPACWVRGGLESWVSVGGPVMSELTAETVGSGGVVTDFRASEAAS